MNDNKNGKQPKNIQSYLRPWLQKQNQRWLSLLVNQVATLKRELSSEEIDQIYKVLIDDSELGELKLKAKRVENVLVPVVDESAEEAINNLKLISLEEVKGVNALVADQKLSFHSRLTVIFGFNAAGKTGYVRVLKKACDSRSVESILPNVFESEAKETSAKITLECNNMKQEIIWNGEQGVHPLNEVQVFDSKCAKIHLLEELTFAFEPFDLEIFEYIAVGIISLKGRLQEDIKRKEKFDDLLADLSEGTKKYEFVDKLSPSNTFDQIEAITVWNEDLENKLKTSITGKKELESQNLDAKIRRIKNDDEKIEELKNKIKEITGELSENIVEENNNKLQKLIEAQRVANERQNKLSHYGIDKQASAEWLAFIKSAEIYIKGLDNHEHYPTTQSECIYCKQKLTEPAQELIKNYRSLVSSEEIEEVEKAEMDVSAVVLKLERVSFLLPAVKDGEDNPLKQAIDEIDSQLYQSISNACDKAEGQRIKTIDLLKAKVDEALPIAEPEIDEINTKLVSITEEFRKRKETLESDESTRRSSVASLIGEIIELTDQKTLSQKKHLLIGQLESLQWIEKARKAEAKLNTKSVTDLGKIAWKELVSDSFKERFEAETKNLDVKTLVEFAFPGEHGVQKRVKSIREYSNIDDILSESEQKAIALADFFAELDVKETKAPIVFDDPVNSFDHRRIAKVAVRIIEESNERQVIVFTHNVMLLAALYGNTSESGQSGIAAFHTIEANDNCIGLITLDDHPFVEDVGSRIEKTKSRISEASSQTGSNRADTISSAFGIIRAGCEDLMVKQVFGGVVQRLDPTVKMMRVTQIKYDESMVDDIKGLWEECSAYVEAHSHADAQIDQQPTLEDLKNCLAKLEGLNASVKGLKKKAS